MRTIVTLIVCLFFNACLYDWPHVGSGGAGGSSSDAGAGGSAGAP